MVVFCPSPTPEAPERLACVAAQPGSPPPALRRTAPSTPRPRPAPPRPDWEQAAQVILLIQTQGGRGGAGRFRGRGVTMRGVSLLGDSSFFNSVCLSCLRQPARSAGAGGGPPRPGLHQPLAVAAAAALRGPAGPSACTCNKGESPFGLFKAGVSHIKQHSRSTNFPSHTLFLLVQS